MELIELIGHTIVFITLFTLTILSLSYALSKYRHRDEISLEFKPSSIEHSKSEPTLIKIPVEDNRKKFRSNPSERFVVLNNLEHFSSKNKISVKKKSLFKLHSINNTSMFNITID